MNFEFSCSLTKLFAAKYTNAIVTADANDFKGVSI